MSTKFENIKIDWISSLDLNIKTNSQLSWQYVIFWGCEIDGKRRFLYWFRFSNHGTTAQQDRSLEPLITETKFIISQIKILLRCTDSSKFDITTSHLFGLSRQRLSPEQNKIYHFCLYVQNCLFRGVFFRFFLRWFSAFMLVTVAAVTHTHIYAREFFCSKFLS